MDVNISSKNNVYTVVVSQYVDSMTAPQLTRLVVPLVADAQKIIFDFTDLEYISSAGLRVIINVYQQMTAKGGEIVIRHASDSVMDVFKITRLDNILNFEK